MADWGDGDAADVPLIGPGIDLTQVPPIRHKRTLAFLNHFCVSMASFLNRFSGVCEEKLGDIAFRLERLEITTSILETKLASIPGLEGVTAEEYVSSTPASAPAATSAPAAAAPAAGAAAPAAGGAPPAPPPPDASGAPPAPPAPGAEEAAPAEAPPAAAGPTVKEDARYGRFFKMAAMGVPAPAIKMKMAAEGLNPDLLDTPDAPAPAGGGGGGDGGGAASTTDSDASNESDSEFSSDDDD